MKNLRLLMLFVCVFVQCDGQKYHPSPSTITDALLDGKYDWRDRGAHGYNDDPPTNVTVNVYLRSIKLLGQDEARMEITFKQAWRDPRLEYEKQFPDGPPFVHMDQSDHRRKIWKPDTFFQNAYDVRTEDLPTMTVLTRIFKDGHVLASQKFALKTTCPLNYHKYPSDTQVCTLEFASYKFTTSDMVYDWKEDTAVQLKEGIGGSVLGLELVNVNTGYCTSITRAGNYSCLRLTIVSLHFERQSGGVWYKLYLVPAVLVFMSLLPMITNEQKLLVRVLIGLGCPCGFIMQWNFCTSQAPFLEHSPSATVWFVGCFVVVAATLVQSMVSFWIGRVATGRRNPAVQTSLVSQTDLTQNVEERKDNLRARLIDWISLAIFTVVLIGIITTMQSMKRGMD